MIVGIKASFKALSVEFWPDCSAKIVIVRVALMRAGGNNMEAIRERLSWLEAMIGVP